MKCFTDVVCFIAAVCISGFELVEILSRQNQLIDVTMQRS